MELIEHLIKTNDNRRWNIIENTISSDNKLNNTEKYELKGIIQEIRSIPLIKIPNKNIIKQTDVMTSYYEKYNELSKKIIGNFSYKINNIISSLNNIPVSVFIDNYYKNVMEKQKEKQKNPDRIDIKKPNIITDKIINKLKSRSGSEFTDDIMKIINEYNDASESDKMNFNFKEAYNFMKNNTNMFDTSKSKTKK